MENRQNYNTDRTKNCTRIAGRAFPDGKSFGRNRVNLDVLPDSGGCESRGGQMAENIDTNPYAPPVSLLNAHKRVIPEDRWLRAFAIFQVAMIGPFITANLYYIFSVYVTGPIFSFAGLCVSIIAYRQRNIIGLIFGSSAVVFTCFIWFLIDYIPLTPAQAKMPVTFLSVGYAAVTALPLLYALFTRMEKQKAEEHIKA